MRIYQLLKWLVAAAVVAAVGAGAYVTRERWLPLVQKAMHHGAEEEEAETASESTADAPAGPAPNKTFVLSDQAIANLGLKAKIIKPDVFWKKIQVPGLIVDRPGLSDRGVVAQATGVIAKVYHFPGDAVSPGEPLFTLRLFSESLHLTQSGLFKAAEDIKLAQTRRERLASAVGALPEARVIEVESEIARLEVTAKAYRQELLTRGFSPEQVEKVSAGTFVSELTIVAPPVNADDEPMTRDTLTDAPAGESPQPSNKGFDERLPTYEVQTLQVELGQQVQAGQALCILANHQALAIEGRAFRDETGLLERSVKKHWTVEADFDEEAANSPTQARKADAPPTSAAAGEETDLDVWPDLNQTFYIQRLSNSIDPVTRTFAFLMPLENQSRLIEAEGRRQMLWRFRPGQRVRLNVKVEQLKNVLVLPADAVVREGPEAYVFMQNTNTFERQPARIIYEDHDNVVLANDGSPKVGTFIVWSAAAQLNRMAKTTRSEVPKGFHIHADGSLHKNEDEGK